MRGKLRSHSTPRQTRSVGSLRARRRGRAFLLLVAFATGQGCYTYSAAELPDLESGTEVRVTLNDEGSRTVLPGSYAVGPRRVEGRFADVSEDSLMISVWIGEAYRGTPFESTYQRVAIPRDDIVTVEDRQLSKVRTGLMAAGVIAVVVTMIDRLGVIPIFGDGDTEPPNPPTGAGTIFRR